MNKLIISKRLINKEIKKGILTRHEDRKKLDLFVNKSTYRLISKDKEFIDSFCEVTAVRWLRKPRFLSPIEKVFKQSLMNAYFTPNPLLVRHNLQHPIKFRRYVRIKK